MFNNQATEIQVPSNPLQCSRLRKIVGRIASYTLRNPEAVADVELAFGEAFSNAVKYGENGSKVSVRIEPISNRGLALEMAYPGASFDTTVTLPKDKGDAKGGFGRYIITQVMDSLEYSFDSGCTRVRMTKRK